LLLTCGSTHVLDELFESQMIERIIGRLSQFVIKQSTREFARGGFDKWTAFFNCEPTF